MNEVDVIVLLGLFAALVWAYIIVKRFGSGE